MKRGYGITAQKDKEESRGSVVFFSKDEYPIVSLLVRPVEVRTKTL